MSEQALYLVKLNFKTNNVGGASMTLQLAIDPMSIFINGRANGTFHQGTQHTPSFTASTSGQIHSTGFGNITKVGGVTGQAVVSFPPPAIGSYLAPFEADFAVDNEWNGTGSFSVGTDTYKCQVTKAA